MARPAPKHADEETVVVPATVRFPVELTPPEGFDPARLETWPRVEGRLEWVAGRLLYMPPCGVRQAETVADVVTALGIWARTNREFVVGTNEAGMMLGDDVRGADAGVWRRPDGPADPGLSKDPPLLAVEVAGRDEGERVLREKARWYLGMGVPLVWLVLPAVREVIVVTPAGDSRYRIGERLPAAPRLPGLAPTVDELFLQVSLAGG